MSIEYRGDNKYRFRVRKDGVNYTDNFYCDKKISEKDIEEKNWPKDVKDAHKKYEVEIMTGNVGSNENMKFVELAQEFMDIHVKENLSEGTQAQYLRIYNNYLLEYFGGISIKKITTSQVQKFLNDIRKKLKVATIQSIFSKLNATLNYAIRMGYIKENPCKNTTFPVDDKVKINYFELLSSDEIKNLFTAILAETNIKHRLMFLIAFSMGLRKGEILGLTVERIDFEKNVIYIKDQWMSYCKDKKLIQKTGKLKTKNSYRSIYMPDFLSKELKGYIDSMKIINIKSQYIFNANGSNYPYSHANVNIAFYNFLKRNNLKIIKFHDLRHLHATMLINSGSNIVSVAKRLGDTVETISKTYLHSIDKIDKESVDQYENLLNRVNENV